MILKTLEGESDAITADSLLFTLVGRACVCFNTCVRVYAQ
jgi:hypothetical protein